MSDADKATAEALVSEFGMETETSGSDSDMADFFSDARPETAVHTPEPEKFVHEPTGKEFESEVEFLRYDAGWKNDQWGRKFKELEERVSQKAETPKAEPEVNSLTKPQIKDRIFPNQPQEYKDNPVADMFVEGIDNSLGLYDVTVQKRMDQLSEMINSVKSQMQETALRSQYGVDASVEQKLTEKHTWLKGISDPAARMAAMKDLVGSTKAPETVSPKLADKIPRRNAADHVEGSAVASPPDTNDFESKFDKLDPRKQLSVLGQMLAKDGEFAGWRPERD